MLATGVRAKSEEAAGGAAWAAGGLERLPLVSSLRSSRISLLCSSSAGYFCLIAVLTAELSSSRCRCCAADRRRRS
eukprot:932177-Pleurochrysis_carterae.AAC.2